MSRSTWTHSPICYHEPRVHDHELYFHICHINLVALLPIAIMGVICNAGALIFLYRPPKITSGVFVYLKALLVLDHCQLLITASNALIPQLCDFHHSKEHTFYTFCTFERRFLKHTLQRFEMTINLLHVWTISALSAHRYWKISRPVIARLKDTVYRAHMYLFMLFVVCIFFRLPIFFLELEVGWRPKIHIKRRIAATELFNPYRFLYHSVFDPLLSNVVPFIWMTVFSLLTLYEIYRSRNISYRHLAFDFPRGNGLTHPLTSGYRKKAEITRQKQELRATISIVLIIILYLLFHTLKLYALGRKWQLMMEHQCPTRNDYYYSQMADILSMVSSSVNAFVFIAFTTRVKNYVAKLIRKASRTLSSSSDPPLSPKTTVTVEGCHFPNNSVHL